VEGLALDVSGSIGIAVYPEDSSEVEALLRRADVAMYSAKEAGGGHELYTPELDRHSPERLTLVSRVRPGLENGEFVLHYQPKLRVADERTTGVEALVRWDHPERGLVGPDEFIPLLERTVLLRPLTHYVLDHALRQWQGWSRRGVEIDVAVNLSPRSLLDVQLPDQVGELLGRWAVPPGALTLELTESFLMAESGRSVGVLSALADVGVKLSIDDFGTGYSSLSHLKRLPICEIKIDRSFVMNMTRNPGDAMIVRATIDLARNLGLQVVAEGVEDQETVERLAEMGCDLMQGFRYSRPLAAADLVAHLRSESGRDIPRGGPNPSPALVS
jgi:EAL domain-containing protein (putative c-di-GMP-specific phosphodiesterase class I)